MRRMNASEHALLAEVLVVVLLGLGIEPRIVVWIPRERCRSRGNRRTQDGLIDPANAARLGGKTPGIVALLRVGITPADESDTAQFVRRQHRIEAEDPVTARILEVGIDRNRFDLGSSDQLVSGVVTDLEILDLLLHRTFGLILGVAVIEPQIVVIRSDRTEHVVPNDLGTNVRIVGVDQGERLSGNIAHKAPMVVGEANLSRVFLSRILVRGWPVHALDLVEHPWW